MNTRVAIRKTPISAAIITALALAPVSGFTSGDRHHPPAHITIHGPNSGNLQGLTTTTGWSLMLRIEVPDSVAIVESPEELDACRSAGAKQIVFRGSRRLHRHAALPDHQRRNAV